MLEWTWSGRDEAGIPQHGRLMLRRGQVAHLTTASGSVIELMITGPGSKGSKNADKLTN
jgi:hypothetical protein